MYSNKTYLCHYGVQGMKWGVRKQRLPSTNIRRRRGKIIPTRGGLTRNQRETANRRLAIRAVKDTFHHKMNREKGSRYANRYLKNHARTKVSSIVLTTAATVGAAAAAKYVMPKAVAVVANKAGKDPYAYYRMATTVGRGVDRVIGKGAVGAGAAALALKGAGMLNNKRLANNKQTKRR